MVYYRKYRPQTIADLDSSKLRQTLHAILSSKSVPHAFLFTGPKGLGKTSTARIVAKVINCENLKNGEPDNICAQCISITQGTNIDVLEIDGASNRGIDEIRELREKVNLSPTGAKKKVYIIDEVHMLTTEAFNALLKTVEEPPSHVIFIFCTTEPHKVPATIISRCFHISFQLATEEEIVHSLKRIVKGEKIDIDDESLKLIAGMAEGGFRDATKMLEELVALAEGKKITKESFKKSNNAPSILGAVSNLLATFHNEDKKEGVQQGLRIVNELITEGIDIKFFIHQMLGALQERLLKKMGVKEGSEEEYPVNLRFEIEEITILAELLSKAYQETKFAVIPQLPLELAIISYSLSEPGESKNVPVSGQGNGVNTKHTMDTLLKKQKTNASTVYAKGYSTSSRLCGASKRAGAK